MIVRNIDDPEVLATTYRAHGGGTARMVMTSQFLKSIEFFAYAVLLPGKVLEEHVDPVEEIYYILRGRGMMLVGADKREVKERDAIWIPAGEAHSLTNHTAEETEIIVVAAYPIRR
ncbi:MAG: cupin domain-containing protein [Deltaproteobacteria bacterium RBG_16_54_18]|nr:MAG: cupin domain-containing protein [Deltaproteobacteria bacterium RBG_16_54_18]